MTRYVILRDDGLRDATCGQDREYYQIEEEGAAPD